ncbi:MAG: SprB repeat-containing protein [Saprospiraceae bacterium]|nr:SprB repeat-containing protein [Saprospiraceae bacterium]
MNVSCNAGSNGSIDLSVSGGTSPYTYNWGGGIVSEDRSGLAQGTYTVTVTDNLGCSTTLSATISEPTVLSLSSTQVNVSCNAGSNGSIDLTVSGGTGPYTYYWGGASSKDRSGLLPALTP